MTPITLAAPVNKPKDITHKSNNPIKYTPRRDSQNFYFFLCVFLFLCIQSHALKVIPTHSPKKRQANKKYIAVICYFYFYFANIKHTKHNIK